MPKPRNRPLDAATDLALRGVLRSVAPLPYHRRVAVAGAAFARLLGPALGWTTRAHAHIAYAWPDLPKPERDAAVRACIDNAGRNIVEMYAGAEFTARARAPFTGEGVAAFEAARAEGRPVIVVSAHLGNHNAMRAGLIAKGHPLAALYRPLSNPRTEAHYAAALTQIGGPLFARGRDGMAATLKHLRGGGVFGVMIDLHVGGAPELSFFGRPAHTALTAAELAARYDALLVPAHAIRRPNGIDFDLRIGPPAPPGPPEARMQWLNDDLEALVRAHPGQWWWVPRRWRPEG